MHTLPTLLTLALSGTLAFAARSGALLHGHNVESIPHHITRDLFSRAAGSVATFAFYDSSSCNSQPEFLQAQNATCYGPLVRESSFQLVGISKGCQAIARIHPCGTDNSALSILEPNGKCWQVFTAETEIDVWVQCGLPPVFPSRVAGQQQPPSTATEQSSSQIQPTTSTQPVVETQPAATTQSIEEQPAAADQPSEQPPAENWPTENNVPTDDRPVEQNVPAGGEQGGWRGGYGGGQGQGQPARGRQGRRWLWK